MSTAYRNRRKERKRRARNIEIDGERLGTLLNQIRRGVAPRLTWWKGPARFQLGERRKARSAEQCGQKPFSKRWKEIKTFRRGPKILSTVGVLFGTPPKMLRG